MKKYFFMLIFFVISYLVIIFYLGFYYGRIYQQKRQHSYIQELSWELLQYEGIAKNYGCDNPKELLKKLQNMGLEGNSTLIIE